MSFLFRYLRFHDIIGGIHVPVDDGVDKLNRKYTLLVFLFLALPIFTKQYIGDPIECFAPVYFAEHQSRYINSYCWTQSTYYMVPVGDPDDDGDQQEPPDRITPDELDYFISFETVTHIGNERLRRVRVSYYQWAPLILLAQGLCFYIPFLIWNSCANNAGVKLRRLLKKASDIASLPPGCQQREALLAEFVDQFHTLVMGEAGWCADLQCGGPGGGSGANGVSSSNPNAALSGSSAGSSASNSSAGSGPAHHHQHHHGHHHGHQQQANGAPVGSATTVGRNLGQPGSRSAQGQAGNAPSNPNDDHHHRSNSSSHHHHQSSSSSAAAAAAAAAGQPSGCCLVGIPILGSLISCCLKPCSSFGLVGPSKYLCLLYLAVKFAYVFNVGLQFFLLGKFLGRGYLRHGLELINRVLLNGEWWASPRFPLSTLCQVRADMSGGLRSYTCQCVLPINVFNEKIFSVVWFYMAFLLPLNVLSLLFWVYRTFESNRMSYIRLCLWRTRLVELNQIHRTVRRLSQSYLGWDGVFLLRLIEHNHGSIMATLIMSRLWEFYANQIKLQEDANQIALANNAHNTLSSLTTAQAIQASQHQHQPPPPPPPAQLPQSHGHNPQGHPQQQQQQQQYLTNQPHSHANPLAHAHSHHHGPGGGGGGGPPHHHHHQIGAAGGHHNHPHQGHGHALHGPHAFAAHGPGPHPPLQPTQATSFGAAGAGAGTGAHPPPPPPMLAHGHHSGQVSQAAGHHPLHAANTAATAHHVHHAALTAAALTAAASNSASSSSGSNGPHLSGAFTGAHANLLAQLHHQAASNQQQAQSNQQQPPGNVAAAVAALAAAAAAATSNQPAASANQSVINSTTGNQAPSSNTSAAATNSSIHLNSLKQQQSTVTSTPISTMPTANQSNVQTSVSHTTNGSAQPPGTNQTATATANSATTSFITPATGNSGPPLPPPPPAHVVAAVAAASGVATTAAPVKAALSAQPMANRGTTTGSTQSNGVGSPVVVSANQPAPAPPPHSGTNLFSTLKSSNLQQTTSQANSSVTTSSCGPIQANGQVPSRFTNHSISKRT